MKKMNTVNNKSKSKNSLNGLSCSCCAAEVEKADEAKKAENNFDNDQPDQINNYWKYRFWPGVLIFMIAVIIFYTPMIAKVSTNESAFFASAALYLKWLLFGSSYLLIGGPVLKAALGNIKRGKVFDENFLMTVATVGAFIIQEFPEGVAVMLFYMLGEMFQNKAVDHSRRSIKSLMDIKPEYANLKKDGKIIRTEPESIKTGEVILIKPGEKVPLDGKIMEGSSMLDTSALTGESIPRQLKKGDEILSGMINKDGLLTVRVTKEYEKSTVAKILNLVENASERKAPTEKFISRFARYYTPVVVYSALAIAILPPLFLSGASFSEWFYRALVFLVISCPCALVISIPLGFFGGIGRASRQGILIKGGNYLEALNNVRHIVFDKTGTLTEGKFAVSDIVPAAGFSEKELLKKAAYAESHSTHPIAKSIISAYQDIVKNDEINLNYEVDNYNELSGKGIKAVVNGEVLLLGNKKLMIEEGIDYQKVESRGSVVYIAVDNKFAGYIIINDKLKKDAKKTIEVLKEIGIDKVSMLTGDRKESARETARILELDDYYAELLPDQKVNKLEELISQKRNSSEKLIFVGDGINDAPVLARADIGVAMGSLGSDAAIEAADVVLMTDEPSKLVTAINTASKTRQIVWQNIIMALGVKGIVLVMGVFGMANMWSAVFADVGVALLAVFNAVRISTGVKFE